MGCFICGLIQLPTPPQRNQVVTPFQRHKGNFVETCRHRAVVYEQALQRNPRRWSGSTRFWRQPKVGCINPPLPDIELNSATFAMAAWTAAEASSLMAANGSIALLLSTRQVWQGQIFPFLSRPYGLQPEVAQISYGPWVSFGVVGMTCSRPKSYPAGCMPRIGFAL